MGQDEASDALGYGIKDYEDAPQAAAANACSASWLVTRDSLGFAGSPVPGISPADFLMEVGAPQG